MKTIFSKIWFPIFVLFAIVSCREDIIPPGNFVGNINEPVQIKDNNTYTFLINAKDLTLNVKNKPLFTSATSKITINIFDYRKGYITIRVDDRFDNERFNYFGNRNIDFFTESFLGWVSDTISISAVNFSAKIKIELRRTF